jgi:hypothetical protein
MLGFGRGEGDGYGEGFFVYNGTCEKRTTPNDKQATRGTTRRDILEFIETAWGEFANERVIEVMFFGFLKTDNRTTTLLDFIIKSKTFIF